MIARVSPLLLSVSLLALTGCTSDATEPSGASEEALAACTDTVPLALTEEPSLPSIEAARTAFNEAKTGGGSWSNVEAITLYSYADCTGPVSLEGLEDALPAELQQEIHFLRGENALDRSGLESDRFFSGESGAPLLEELDTWAGTTASLTATGVRHWDELSCHNCTERRVVLLVHYPDARKLAVVEGEFGWDS